jgi:multiple antibiotic resistance protein
MAVTVGLEQRDATRVALYAVSIAFAVLTFFIICGELLLNSLHIPIASFQLAGSLLFLMLGLQMATGHFHGPSTGSDSGHSLFSRAVYPLAMPGIAGGAAILTVVVMTENNTHSVSDQFSTGAVMMVCLGIDLLAMLSARHLQRIFGHSGITVVTQVMGLILTSIAVNGLIVAIKISFNLPL